LEPLKIFYSKKLKNSSVQTQGGRVFTVYQIDEQFGDAYKRAATGEVAAKDFLATGLFVTRTATDHTISL
jgi:phosphoribosylamine-glycine ligase